MAGSKRGARWFVLGVAALMLLSACRVKIDVATQVEEDGSGEIAVTFLLGQTVRETLQAKERKSDDPAELAEIRQRGEDIFERGEPVIDELARDIPEGWDAERATEGNNEGFVLRGSFSSLDEIPSLLEPLAGFGDEIAQRMGRDAADFGPAMLVRGLSITRDGPQFHFEAHPNAEEYEGAGEGPNRLATEFSLTVDLPGGIREHDADEEVDGALVWHIAPGTSRDISATSDLTYDPVEIPWVPIGVGGSTAAIVGLLGLRHLRSRRRSSGGDDPPGPPGVHDDVPVPV